MSLRAQIEAALSTKPVRFTMRLAEGMEPSTFVIQKLSGDDISAIGDRYEKVPERLRMYLDIAACVTDEDGVHLWDMDDEASLEELCRLGGPIRLTLLPKVHDVNGLRADEELAKNSEERTDG